MPDAAARLKDIERQTLHWTAEGKTAAEVAAMLEMTERNVNFHIRNAITKLNAANKTHAVVKAALLGLIPAVLQVPHVLHVPQVLQAMARTGWAGCMASR